MKEVALCGRVDLGSSLPLDQNFQEQGEKIEILLGGWQRKRIDLEILGLQADAHIRSPEQLCEAFKASTQIEDEGVRSIFLQVRDEEIQEKRFPGAGPAENHGVSHIPVMEVQEVRRVMVGLENRKIFLPKMRVARLATVQGEEKREVGIVGVEQVQGAQVESM